MIRFASAHEIVEDAALGEFWEIAADPGNDKSRDTT